MIHPGYYALAVTVGAIAFSAGGFFAGTKVGSDNNAKDHKTMDEDIKNLDVVKMSRSVCTERHNHIGDTLKRIEGKVDRVLKMNGV